MVEVLKKDRARIDEVSFPTEFAVRFCFLSLLVCLQNPPNWRAYMFMCNFITIDFVMEWINQRFATDRCNWLRRVLLHVLVSAVLSFALVACEAALLTYTGVSPSIVKGFGATFLPLLRDRFYTNFMLYFALFGVRLGFAYHRSFRKRALHAS